MGEGAKGAEIEPCGLVTRRRQDASGSKGAEMEPGWVIRWQ